MVSKVTMTLMVTYMEMNEIRSGIKDCFDDFLMLLWILYVKMK